jgi:hypothetical protein
MPFNAHEQGFGRKKKNDGNVAGFLATFHKRKRRYKLHKRQRRYKRALVWCQHSSATYIFCHYCTYLHNKDKFWPWQKFVKLSTSPLCTNISSQYNSTPYNDNAQHSARYISTKRTTLPLPSKSQRTHLSTINVHNARPIDSAHFAQPMSHNSTYTSPSLVHLCNNRTADRTRFVSYIGRQYARTIPNVDIVCSRKCHTRHLAIEGVTHFNYVLATNSNPVMTCALRVRRTS